MLRSLSSKFQMNSSSTKMQTKTRRRISKMNRTKLPEPNMSSSTLLTNNFNSPFKHNWTSKCFSYRRLPWSLVNWLCFINRLYRTDKSCRLSKAISCSSIRWTNRFWSKTFIHLINTKLSSKDSTKNSRKGHSNKWAKSSNSSSSSNSSRSNNRLPTTNKSSSSNRSNCNCNCNSSRTKSSSSNNSSSSNSRMTSNNSNSRTWLNKHSRCRPNRLRLLSSSSSKRLHNSKCLTQDSRKACKLITKNRCNNKMQVIMCKIKSRWSSSSRKQINNNNLSNSHRLNSNNKSSLNNLSNKSQKFKQTNNKRNKSQHSKMLVTTRTIRSSIKNNSSWTNWFINIKSIRMKWNNSCRYHNNCNKFMLITKLRNKKHLKMARRLILKRIKLWWKFKRSYLTISSRSKIWRTRKSNMSIKSFKFSSNFHKWFKRTFHGLRMRAPNNSSSNSRMQIRVKINSNNSKCSSSSNSSTRMRASKKMLMQQTSSNNNNSSNSMSMSISSSNSSSNNNKSKWCSSRISSNSKWCLSSKTNRRWTSTTIWCNSSRCSRCSNNSSLARTECLKLCHSSSKIKHHLTRKLSRNRIKLPMQKTTANEINLFQVF